MRDFRHVFLGSILPVLLLIGGVGLFVLLRAPEPPLSPPANPNKDEDLLAFVPAAEVAEVRVLSDSLNIQANGTVVPYRELRLAAEVSGRIVEKDPLVRSGNYVKKGQLLYRIDPRDYELEIERLTRRREQELASIQELDQEITNARKLLEIAKDQVQLAEDEVTRIRSMNKNFSSAAELDEARRSWLTSRNQAATLENQILAAESRRTRLEYAAKLVETELDQAELNLERTTVTSPVDGLVISESVEIDSFVQKGAELLQIEDTEKVEVACNVRMDQLSWILEQPAMSRDTLVNAAQASRWDLPDTPAEIEFRVAGRDSKTYRWEGVLDRVDGAGLDPQSRTVPLRIRIDNPADFRTTSESKYDNSGPPLLVRGMFVDVVIRATPATQLLLVPKLSIKPATKSSVIWKFSENPDAIRETPQALEAIAAYSEAEAAGTVDELYKDVKKKDDGTAKIVPSEWEAGNLEIIDGVRLVSSYWEDTTGVEYWVCEVPDATLAAGDKVIVTPLPGVRADGSDVVRIKAESVESTAKAESEVELAGGSESVIESEG